MEYNLPRALGSSFDFDSHADHRHFTYSRWVTVGFLALNIVLCLLLCVAHLVWRVFKERALRLEEAAGGAAAAAASRLDFKPRRFTFCGRFLNASLLLVVWSFAAIARGAAESSACFQVRWGRCLARLLPISTVLNQDALGDWRVTARPAIFCDSDIWSPYSAGQPVPSQEYYRHGMLVACGVLYGLLFLWVAAWGNVRPNPRREESRCFAMFKRYARGAAGMARRWEAILFARRAAMVRTRSRRKARLC